MQLIFTKKVKTRLVDFYNPSNDKIVNIAVDTTGSEIVDKLFKIDGKSKLYKYICPGIEFHLMSNCFKVYNDNGVCIYTGDININDVENFVTTLPRTMIIDRRVIKVSDKTNITYRYPVLKIMSETQNYEVKVTKFLEEADFSAMEKAINERLDTTFIEINDVRTSIRNIASTLSAIPIQHAEDSIRIYSDDFDLSINDNIDGDMISSILPVIWRYILIGKFPKILYGDHAICKSPQ